MEVNYKKKPRPPTVCEGEGQTTSCEEMHGVRRPGYKIFGNGKTDPHLTCCHRGKNKERELG